MSSSNESSDLEAILKYREGSIQACFDFLDPCPRHLKETSINVPLSDGTTIRAIITRPASASTGAQPRKCPLIILFHGGGWVAGAPEQMLVPARGYATRLGAIVACASYRFAPEDPFPAPMHSAWDVTAWLSDPENLNRGPALGWGEDEDGDEDDRVEFDPALGVVVGGASAGAHVAAVVAGISAAESAAAAGGGDGGSSVLAGERLRRLARPVSGVFLAVPVLLHESMVPLEYAPLWTSRVDNRDAPMLPAKKLGDDLERLGPDYHSPWFSPLNIDLDTLRGHHAPRVYVQAGQLDCLRDDAVVYGRVLQDKGISETKIDVLDGVDHDGWSTFSIPLWGRTDILRKVSLDGMAWVLGRDWDKSQQLPY